MAIIPLPEIDPTSLRPSAKGLADRGALINVFKMFLISPELGNAFVDVGMTLLSYTELSAIDREIATLVTGTCCECAYEIDQHGPASRAAGVTDEQRQAIAEMQWKSPAFTAGQTALIQFVVSALRNPEVPAAVMEAARQHYSDRQVVELTVLAGLYFTLARVATVFDVEIDAPEDARVIETLVAMGRGVD